MKRGQKMIPFHVQHLRLCQHRGFAHPDPHMPPDSHLCCSKPSWMKPRCLPHIQAAAQSLSLASLPDALWHRCCRTVYYPHQFFNLRCFVSWIIYFFSVTMWLKQMDGEEEKHLGVASISAQPFSWLVKMGRKNHS